MKGLIAAMLIFANLVWEPAAAATEDQNPYKSPSNVSINGYVLNWMELARLKQSLGYTVLPGAYLYNVQNGCWINSTSGASGCLGNQNSNAGIYTSRYGSGERNNEGDWSHYSNAAGGGVGGTGDGCVYAFGWSNC